MGWREVCGVEEDVWGGGKCVGWLCVGWRKVFRVEEDVWGGRKCVGWKCVGWKRECVGWRKEGGEKCVGWRKEREDVGVRGGGRRVKCACTVIFLN